MKKSMQKDFVKFIVLFVAFVVAFIGVGSITSVFAQSSSSDIYCVITEITKDVAVQLGVDLRWGTAKKGMALEEGARVATGSDGAVEIVFEDGSVLRAEGDTAFSVEKAKQEESSIELLFSLVCGRILNNVLTSTDTKIKYQMKTPVSVMGVRGTIFVVEHVKDDSTTPTEKSDIAVYDGEVAVQSITREEEPVGPEVLVDKDQQTSVIIGKPALKPHPIEERLMVYYEKVVQQFNERVENYRKNMDEIRKQRMEWMEKEKRKYEDKMRQDKQKQEDKFKKLKEKHGFE
jgi:hypothetical protein